MVVLPPACIPYILTLAIGDLSLESHEDKVILVPFFMPVENKSGPSRKALTGRIAWEAPLSAIAIGFTSLTGTKMRAEARKTVGALKSEFRPSVDTQLFSDVGILLS